MMLGVSAGLMPSSGAAGETHDGSSEVGGPSSNIPGGVMEESDRSGGGNRWPRQETLALLKIRSDMDGVFRDASLKGPLWDEVSRKMAELGFQRSAKKCKEKFENVYKYHKRTKDGRASKPDGKSYRFFDQLEAFENTPPNNPFTTPPPPQARPPPPVATPSPPNPLQIPPNITVSSSTSPTPLSIVPPIPNIAPKPTNNPVSNINPSSFQPINTTFPSFATSSSSSTSSDEDIQIRRRRGRKRKWKDYFERLMRDVIVKQEEMQNKFLDALEKRERDRIAREEAWRAQETARINRERDLLVQERSVTTAKDNAVIAFLQKVTNEPSLRIPVIANNNTSSNVPPSENPQPPPMQPPAPAPQPVTTVIPTKNLETPKTDSSNNVNSNNNNYDSFLPASSSRWPKPEVHALIKLRTSMDLKYQENGPKGPLWEEISAAMAKLGYNRNPKRCKEKWENINKYYKKVKESNKKRPEDSKTCPYFQQLEEIYRDRAIHNNNAPIAFAYGPKPENAMAPIMARPEQQWPLPDQQQVNPLVHDNESDPNEYDDDEDDDDEDDEDGGGGGYEIIANKQQQQQQQPTNTVE